MEEKIINRRKKTILSYYKAVGFHIKLTSYAMGFDYIILFLAFLRKKKQYLWYHDALQSKRVAMDFQPKPLGILFP